MIQRIEILAFPNIQILDVTGPLQVFATANDLAVRAGLEIPYEPLVISTESRITSSSGLTILAENLPENDQPLNTLIIPGGWGIDQACENMALIDWLQQRSQQAKRTASVCSGAFLLAKAGLLEKRRAVTHWDRCDEFAKLFPSVQLESDPIFIQDDNIWTSAGVTAGIDLALALVEADLGHDKAVAVARHLVVFLKRPGGQSQFSAALNLQDSGGRFDELHGWIIQNLHRRLALPDLAEQAGMSERSFSRHYQKETGRSPAKAVKELRLETARRLIEQGLPLNRVIIRCGFGSPETLRRTFQDHFGVSPHVYQDRFAE